MQTTVNLNGNNNTIAFNSNVQNTWPIWFTSATFSITNDVVTAHRGSRSRWVARDDLENLPAGIDMTALGTEIVSFTDTLAIIQSLDLVMAVDTSVAHLAGAAGVPVGIFAADLQQLTLNDRM